MVTIGYTVRGEVGQTIATFARRDDAEDLYTKLNKTAPRQARDIVTIYAYRDLQEYEQQNMLRRVSDAMGKLTSEEREMLQEFFTNQHINKEGMPDGPK